MYNSLAKARGGDDAAFVSVAEMIDRLQRYSANRSAAFGPSAVLCAVAFALFLVGTAAAQQPAPAQPAIPAANPPAAQPPAPAKKPGFFEELGRWFEKSSDEFNANMKKAGRALTEFGDRAGSAAKDATEAVAKLSSTRVVTGNERCELAANGSPDCRAAAEAICRSKGFASGQSLDTQSARKCPMRVWLSGRAPADDECSVETFVTRAACQEPR
jgi:hypothetical protein